jgi:hypothetical protein
LVESLHEAVRVDPVRRGLQLAELPPAELPNVFGGSIAYEGLLQGEAHEKVAFDLIDRPLLHLENESPLPEFGPKWHGETSLLPEFTHRRHLVIFPRLQRPSRGDPIGSVSLGVAAKENRSADIDDDYACDITNGQHKTFDVAINK